MTRFKKEIYGNPYTNNFIAKMEGIEAVIREYSFNDGKRKYSHITGAIILPTFEQPGYLVTIGVEYGDKIKFYCLDEFESDDAFELIKKAQGIQQDYGEDVISHWWGNPLDLMSIVNEINIRDEKNPIRISDPIDANRTDNFEIYTARIKVSLSSEHKTLFLDDANIIRNHIMAFIQAKGEKSGNNPAMHVLGSLIHTLLIMRPWEQAVEKVDMIGTSFEEIANYEYEQTMKYLHRDLEGGLI